MIDSKDMPQIDIEKGSLSGVIQPKTSNENNQSEVEQLKVAAKRTSKLKGASSRHFQRNATQGFNRLSTKQIDAKMPKVGKQRSMRPLTNSRSSLTKNQRCRSPASKNHSKKKSKAASMAETETLAGQRSDGGCYDEEQNIESES